ncbi:diguanylate cyclase [Aliikangiella marina]|uniref:Diguanylate cyclase n=1 Tax=Aliikangiella marina TaxID=1712262 RepID=A0A545T4A0_9GAMM|nr:PAS domain-containing protein [Aliikangiella marina]TQV71998.1 diguanylate cyclase [Aliikangiella marina]TQV72051.1 diguanylate cyclase [Aliikangiella marina]
MSFDQSEIFLKSPLGILVCDENQRITWCNERFLSDTQLDESQVVGQLYAALPVEAIDKKGHLVQLFSESVSDEVKLLHWHQPVDTPAGGQAHYFAKQRNQKDKLSLAAAKLAGAKLANRANWVEFLDYEVSRSRRYDNPLSVLKLQLLVLEKPDSVADETLHQTIKDTLTDELRWADMIGHTDQGTFLTVLPETPESALVNLEEKLRRSITRQLAFVDASMKYEIVFGEASWRKHDDSQLLLKRARDCLVKRLEKLIE